MFLFFYLLEGSFFYERMKPALAKSTFQRSFEPCLELGRMLLARDASIPADALVRSLDSGLPFDRAIWHALVGECLIHGAQDMPRFPTALESLCCLLAPQRRGQRDAPRSTWTPIEQAHLGARDLRFGRSFYRPDRVGFNDMENVNRLASYLASVEPATWKADDLSPLEEFANADERADELVFIKDWWPSLVELYQTARDRQWVVVCEQM